MTPDALLLAVFIFALRIVNSALGTVRVIVTVHQHRWLASALSFIEALVFAIVIANVVKDLTNFLNLMAYCGGFALGNYIGMVIESRYITSYMTTTIIVHDKGHDIAAALRQHGYGVTETLGEGRDGTVTVLRSVLAQRDVADMLKVVRQVHPEAFVSVEEARAIHKGWIRAARGNHR
jgi:uncharacterized protein YebE (UPF0316 family)